MEGPKHQRAYTYGPTSKVEGRLEDSVLVACLPMRPCCPTGQPTQTALLLQAQAHGQIKFGNKRHLRETLSHVSISYS
jgi:hypothetical protein